MVKLRNAVEGIVMNNIAVGRVNRQNVQCCRGRKSHNGKILHMYINSY